ncbi:uncharacterized protein LOC127279729 [Leptopilina boulardi]|uniref:uncharacterized protein LOC127279729 n=1 Tax=Leptopilina boulardi TaxID=63433 RepID=UPI0021F54405|nr:uncharacterized protein LOC127279729 [Leptopilina boulardi]
MSRKRKSNPSEWKDNKRKILKDAGKAYETRNGKPKQEKMSSNCDRVCKCYYEGCALLTKDLKAELFDKFYACNYNAQSAILLSCLSSVPKKNAKNKEIESVESTSRRLNSFNYTIRLSNGETKKICQKTLCDIYAVSHKRIQNLQKKMKDGKVDPKDERGKHLNRPHRIIEDTRHLVREHIKSFPQMENHYSQNKISTDNRMYLNSSLTLNKMFRLFQEKNPESDVKFWLYREVFLNDFNLKIGLPRSDTCKTCDSLYIQLLATEDIEKRKEIEAISETHHLKAENGYASLKKDGENSKINPNTVVLCVDLQQVMYLPMLTHSSIFYQRQLSCYNFAVHNPSTKHAQMFLWHEGIAKRGALEISSCILQYIKQNYQKLNENEERTLIIWSDRCVGQNNNWTTISLLFYLIHERYFTSAEQKFLVSGHSFLPCDRDFALIQRMVNKEAA